MPDTQNSDATLRPTHPLALAPVIAPPASVDGFVKQFLANLNFDQGVSLSASDANDQYLALAGTVRDYLMARWLEDQTRQREQQAKTVCYLSAEYLLGKQLDNNLLAARLGEIATDALAQCGISMDDMREVEVEPGLGNGGLGRLAACFIDSLATMSVPTIGYGIRYEYGIFRQTFVDGQQVEQPDAWLRMGSPWEFPHPEAAQTISFGGRTETYDDNGVERTRWIPDWNVLAVPYNMMVPGYHNGRVNTLRLWRAAATNAFDLRIFNSGDYEESVRAQTFAENISKVLYPEDSTPQGKELRLQQQYFFVAASINDFLDRVLPEGFDLEKLPDRVIFQLNDTHPVIGVPELMRVLVDERGMEWDDAWAITQKCFAYTCHTLLPEALEVWSVDLLGRLLPRHLEIIYRINDDFLDEVRERFGDDMMRLRNMSIIGEHPYRSVRMAYLATVAGAKVNGVAELHSQLLRDKVLHEFAEMYPDKFTNVTNGVTPRRFIRLANPSLASLITEALGAGWTVDLERLRGLEALAEDAEFRERFAAVKAANKRHLSDVLERRDGVTIDDTHLLDVMVKRLHEYKRQTLKVLHIVTEYERIVSGKVAAADIQPRTFIFGAKAAPGYAMAKRIIHLINSVASVVNNDPRVEGRLKVVFPPNYNVTLAESIIPAADLSEQISLAGKEASGTGNMKLALNGALTIGTDDGANVEIRQLVGDDNFFLFGMTEPEVEALWAKGYKPADFYQADPQLRAAMDLIASGAFSGGDRTVFEPIVSNLLYDDRFMVLADYASYIEAQAQVDLAYADQDAWTRSAILNIARCGFFSSDRSMRDYLDRIWHARPLL
ncbi:MAG: glycogen phosphorylase [Actinobacteria bacterium]|uniref:glycogen/starch/alpha-glucan phosphorylase n=1 Tax=Microbacterium schleiferi TaxID=69362 RepID=UPI0010026E62|nr:glycogen/starch/alpha-glucan phosphorylase [Microbacterium schleiferi]MCC4268083.1 glycogen/starch/alpha-glucan phosphorylase [Microbacterium schleiferi]RUA26921.1 MAG: glycogen phosphorylase [Actinomycetota bacterium]